MKIKFLFPIRKEEVKGTTKYFHVTLDTSIYYHNGLYTGKIIKVSFLGFGLRLEKLL